MMYHTELINVSFNGVLSLHIYDNFPHNMYMMLKDFSFYTY